MNILVLGSGGREHALSWRLAQCEQVEKVFCTPGSDGMGLDANINTYNIDPTNFDVLIDFIKKHSIDFVVVGPENLLESGIVDFLQKNEVSVFGPTKEAAKLESSKVYAKELMLNAGIPTARFKQFSCADEAKSFIMKSPWPHGLVVKCDALAAGKGVVVCENEQEALQAVDDFLIQDSLGVGNKKIVVEEKLSGPEVSCFALCSGNDYTILGHACDYKSLYENARGPNTGGMGAYAPVKWLSLEDKKNIDQQVIAKTLQTMSDLGQPFVGVLFVGLMMTQDGPRVLEYNVRFGDPETQALMPLVEGNLALYLKGAAEGTLSKLPPIAMKNAFSVHVVKAAYGYPGTQGTAVRKGDIIEWSEQEFRNKEKKSQAKLFFAGVKKVGPDLVTAGGRVLGVTALGEDLAQARRLAYECCEKVSFEGSQMREDIAKDE